MNPIPPDVEKLWDQWNLRGFMLLSLWHQTFLVLFAPFRKRSSSKWVILSNWSAYLLADWAANFAVGLISNSDNKDKDTGGAALNEELLVFWAPFLILDTSSVPRLDPSLGRLRRDSDEFGRAPASLRSVARRRGRPDKSVGGRRRGRRSLSHGHRRNNQSPHNGMVLKI